MASPVNTQLVVVASPQLAGIGIVGVALTRYQVAAAPEDAGVQLTVAWEAAATAATPVGGPGVPVTAPAASGVASKATATARTLKPMRGVRFMESPDARGPRDSTERPCSLGVIPRGGGSDRREPGSLVGRGDLRLGLLGHGGLGWA